MPARPLLASLALATALVLGASACSDDGSSSDGAPSAGADRSTSTAADGSDSAEGTGTTAVDDPADPTMPGDGTTTTSAGGSTAPGATTPGEDPTTPTTVVDGVAVPVIARAALAAELAGRLEAQVGRAPTGLTCAADLVGIVGRTATCELVDGAERYPVTARVSSVAGLDISFDYEVASDPAP